MNNPRRPALTPVQIELQAFVAVIARIVTPAQLSLIIDQWEADLARRHSFDSSRPLR